MFLYLPEKEYVMADQLFPFRAGGGLWGFRDDQGHTMISPQYDSAGSFAEGFARVKVGGKWGFVDTRGEMVIAPKFDQARFFQGGHAKVQQGAKWGYIDVNGVFVEKLEAGSFIDKTGEFISEKAYQDWGKSGKK